MTQERSQVDPAADDAAPAPPGASEPRDAHNMLTSHLYGALRAIAAAQMREQPPGHTLQPTALVHEAFLRLASSSTEWKSKSHFLATAAKAIRQVLVDHARKRRARQADRRVAIDDPDSLLGAGPKSASLVDLDDALKQLAELHARQAQVVEMRFFGGMTGAEIAHVLGVNRDTVVTDWTAARAWLAGTLAQGASDESQSV